MRNFVLWFAVSFSSQPNWPAIFRNSTWTSTIAGDAIDLACRLRCGDSDADRLKLLFAPPGDFEDPASELGPPPLLEPLRHRRGRPELQLQVKRVVAHRGV
jgi:hypothetical protein